MEKCNCSLCERREFFSKFDKDGKYTGETETRKVNSVYEELVAIHHELLESNASVVLLSRIAEITDRIDEIDTKLGELANISLYDELTELRKGLY